ncbi:hypothetical protein BC940DRAFT_328725 [Gongronella butleri]|nr:hypothetical protein BC940DRAFT_328725 [Gongronella butleri]
MKIPILALFVLVLCVYIQWVAAGFIEPQNNTVWTIGSKQVISWNTSTYTSDETISVFVSEDRSILFGYGPATLGNFTIIVPNQLAPFKGGMIHLIAVVRQNSHLFDGFTTNVNIQ